MHPSHRGTDTDTRPRSPGSSRTQLVMFRRAEISFYNGCSHYLSALRIGVHERPVPVRGYDGFQSNDTRYPICQFATRCPQCATAKLTINRVTITNCIDSTPNATFTPGANDELVIVIVHVGAQFDYSCQGYIPMDTQMIHYVR